MDVLESAQTLENTLEFDSCMNISTYGQKISYEERLRHLKIDQRVIDYINKQVSSIGKTISMTNEELLTHIYIACNVLNIICDIYRLAEMLNVDLQHSSVFRMISNTHSFGKTIDNMSVSIPIIVSHPKNYIDNVLKTLCSNTQLIIQVYDLMLKRITFFCEKLCEYNKFLLQNKPKIMAAAISFLYITEMFPNSFIKKAMFHDNDVKAGVFDKCIVTVTDTFRNLTPDQRDSTIYRGQAYYLNNQQVVNNTDKIPSVYINNTSQETIKKQKVVYPYIAYSPWYTPFPQNLYFDHNTVI